MNGGATLAKVEVLDAKAIERALRRIAHEILERNGGADRLTLIGIRRRGVPLAQRLANLISELEQMDVPCADIDIRNHRDDRLPVETPSPQVEAINEQGTWAHTSVTDRVVVMVDDVLYTGRTVRAAMDALIEWGRPAAIQLAVLIDRGHRELPIRPDYVGKNLPTARQESVEVLLLECDDEEKVQITEGAPL